MNIVLRYAFTPEALSTFDKTMDEVCDELLAHGVVSPANLHADQIRADLARKLMSIASSGRDAKQIKQLLVRPVRNERQAAKRRMGRH